MWSLDEILRPHVNRILLLLRLELFIIFISARRGLFRVLASDVAEVSHVWPEAPLSIQLIFDCLVDGSFLGFVGRPARRLHTLDGETTRGDARKWLKTGQERTATSAALAPPVSLRSSHGQHQRAAALARARGLRSRARPCGGLPRVCSGTQLDRPSGGASRTRGALRKAKPPLRNSRAEVVDEELNFTACGTWISLAQHFPA